MRSSCIAYMTPDSFQTFYYHIRLYTTYKYKVLRRSGHTLTYDKSIYGTFWGINSEFDIFSFIVCSIFITTVLDFLNTESTYHILVLTYVHYRYLSGSDYNWYVFICRRKFTVGNIPYQEGPCYYNRQFHPSCWRLSFVVSLKYTYAPSEITQSIIQL